MEQFTIEILSKIKDIATHKNQIMIDQIDDIIQYKRYKEEDKVFEKELRKLHILLQKYESFVNTIPQERYVINNSLEKLISCLYNEYENKELPTGQYSVLIYESIGKYRELKEEIASILENGIQETNEANVPDDRLSFSIDSISKYIKSPNKKTFYKKDYYIIKIAKALSLLFLVFAIIGTVLAVITLQNEGLRQARFTMLYNSYYNRYQDVYSEEYKTLETDLSIGEYIKQQIKARDDYQQDLEAIKENTPSEDYSNDFFYKNLSNFYKLFIFFIVFAFVYKMIVASIYKKNIDKIGNRFRLYYLEKTNFHIRRDKFEEAKLLLIASTNEDGIKEAYIELGDYTLKTFKIRKVKRDAIIKEAYSYYQCALPLKKAQIKMNKLKRKGGIDL